MSHIAYLDCHSGVSGDKLLGALLDAGLSLDVVKQTLALLPITDYDITLESFSERGIRGSRLTVSFSEREQQFPRHVSDIQALFSASALPVRVRDTGLAVFQRLVEAEATVHGSSIDDVSFFEPEAVNAIVSIIGVAIGIEALGITQFYASSLPLTSGHVQTTQGLLPVPTPTTLEILRRVGAPWKASPSDGELVTPVGAAILATLARFEMPTIAIEQIGYGFGQKHLSWPDGLRLYLGTAQGAAREENEEADVDWVTVISSNIDNMSGELLGGLMERLFAVGALDVSYTPMQMKKNRPATMVMVICPPEKGNALARVLLSETTTLGVRVERVQRLKAQRTQQQIDTPLGPMLVKVKRLGTRVISAAPEYEECQRIALEQNIPLVEVYTAAQNWIASTIIENRKE